MSTAIVLCEVCGTPVKVVFNDEGEIENFYGVCMHIKENKEKWKKDGKRLEDSQNTE